MGLTNKQQTYATLLGSSDITHTQAYIDAGYSPNQASTTIWNNAYMLSQNSEVKAMANEVRATAQAEIMELSGFTKGKAWQQSQADHALAHANDQAGAASTATKLSSQLAGHLDDSTPTDKALLALGELMASIAKAGGDAPPIIEQDGQRDGYTIEHDANPLKTKADT
jgi:hypothetical protein